MMDETLLADVARRLQSKYYGKYRGFVVDNADPDQRGRLRVRVPSLLGDQVLDWALPCVPYGGSPGLGWFFIPDVDAQIWVEFEEGDLRRPIWTGTFWQQPGDVPKDAQKTPPTTRILQTTTGHILRFDDEVDHEQIRLQHAGGTELVMDERGSITLTDKEGNVLSLDADAKKITLADTNRNVVTLGSSGVKIEDGNQNSVELAAKGVTITSVSQIVLDSPLVFLGGSGGEPVIKGLSFLTTFATHVHTASGPGSPTSPPMPPSAQSANSSLSTAVLTK
jgi:uncharacterized protein involved in type VI secretion and phage assembly